MKCKKNLIQYLSLPGSVLDIGLNAGILNFNYCWLVIRAGILLLFLYRPIPLQSQESPVDPSAYQEIIRVACIGASVTAGVGLINGMDAAYPAFLQQELGGKYVVQNFGVSGATLLCKGQKPYLDTEEFREMLSFEPHIVVIDLGLNDIQTGDWPIFRDDFTKDFHTLIKEIRGSPVHPKIWVCKLTPIFSQFSDYKSGAGIWQGQVQEAIEIVANTSGTGVIDLHTPLYYRPDLFPDFIHPDAKGAAIIAHTIYQEITGDFGGLQVPGVFGSKMVIQREKDIAIWGKGNYNQKVEVVFGDENATAKADAHGNWQVVFPPKKAGGPFTITIMSESQRMVFSDVLIGEVWLCSGQSNMDFKTAYSFGAEEALSKANQPDIRLMSLKTADKTITTHWDQELLNKINDLVIREETWSVCTPESAGEFSAVGYYFGLKLYSELKVPVGLIDNSKGGSPAEAWIDRKCLEANPALVDVFRDWRNNSMTQKWCRERADFNCRDASNPLQRHPYEPAYLFEALIKPLTGFQMRGVIWYQGEANAQNVELHEQLFPELVQSWRTAWDQDFPFYYVQLSSFYRPGWPLFRDSQRRLMRDIPNSGMAVSTDMGDSLDIHPSKKKEVGERLALWALAKDYGKTATYSGPLFSSAVFGQGRAVVEFDHGEGLKSSDGEPLRSFEIAGEDRIFKPAKAVVIGDKIEINSTDIQNPRYVRYGWQPFTRGNLVNGADLPASTFSSEFEK